MKKINFLFLVILVSLSLSSLTAQKENPLAEAFKVMENSEISYELLQLEEKIGTEDFTMNLVTAEFYLEEKEGMILTKKIELSEEETKLKEKAESFYLAKDYSKARIEYEKLFDVVPHYSKIATYIGETYLMEGDNANAKIWLNKSLEINPKNYLTHLFLGRLLLKEGEKDKGNRHILRANILNRNAVGQQKELILILEESGYTYDQWYFTPQHKLVEVEKDKKYQIHFTEEWMGYGLVKAVWNCEKGFRKKKGFEEGQGLVEEEKEALGGYILSASSAKKSKDNETLSKLSNSIEKDLVNEFILYEILLRKYPQIGIQLPDELLVSIEDYILEIRCNKKEIKKKKKGKKKK